jgi:hypothetical protein
MGDLGSQMKVSTADGSPSQPDESQLTHHLFSRMKVSMADG